MLRTFQRMRIRSDQGAKNIGEGKQRTIANCVTEDTLKGEMCVCLWRRVCSHAGGKTLNFKEDRHLEAKSSEEKN